MFGVITLVFFDDSCRFMKRFVHDLASEMKKYCQGISKLSY